MIYIGKNIAGKYRFMITFTGLVVLTILAWVVGKIFMPKTNSNYKQMREAVWFYKNESGYTRFQIKSSGYFYFDIVPTKGKSKQYKGVLSQTISDTFIAISFNNDTLLYHKIISNNSNHLILKSIKDTSSINFTK
jgi:hypothetical protein